MPQHLLVVHVGMAFHVSTIAGRGDDHRRDCGGFSDGPGAAAIFNFPVDVAVDCHGNVTVADLHNHRIRQISPSGKVSTLAGSGERGCTDGHGIGASFNFPVAIAHDHAGSLIVSSIYSDRICQVSPSGRVTTSTGCGMMERCNFRGAAVDNDGNVLLTDICNHCICQVSRTGAASTVAGNGETDFIDGKGQNSSFHSPHGVAIDSKGNVIVADSRNHRIREITSDGNVTTLAGNGDEISTDGQGAHSSFNFPHGVAVDGDDNIIVADSGGNCIRMVTRTGRVTTLAGSGIAEFTDGPGAIAAFNGPGGIAVDGHGNVIVADTGNHCIRVITVRLKPPARLCRKRVMHTLVCLRELMVNQRAGLRVEEIDGTLFSNGSIEFMGKIFVADSDHYDSLQKSCDALQRVLMALMRTQLDIFQRVISLL